MLGAEMASASRHPLVPFWGKAQNGRRGLQVEVGSQISYPFGAPLRKWQMTLSLAHSACARVCTCVRVRARMKSMS